ncbi:MAG: tetratricopeptide repeat protein, partial [Nitrospinaceae bacterium]|nr:tetratricopeptide repeat protein [Nitrospinaceae bacterium]NIR54843.1 tetratricopeptide repeat protein [Nitrospinaceae bacterium]NIS85268.1 tetratricopeptide repeat protein [Nitrospinaceae bacterium]NIT82081.1 tetratricopeptide repeat protein [Nitrospinaceae bacterium]NIU44342.1 tetratricopeptide repeat protein [Nitrospinaceae bacterium]
AGRLTEAIEVYRDYLSRTPDDYQARFNLALALMTRDRCAEAIEHLDRVLELRPDLKEAHQNLATC